MDWQLRALLVAFAAFGCTPDEFDYAGSAAGGASSCHEDGCQNPCPLGTREGPDGSCEPICGTWQASLQLPSPGGLVAAGAEVYAVGTSAADDGRPAQGLVQPADACAGQLADAIRPLSDKGSSLGAVAVSSGTLVVAGSSEGKTTLAELDLTSGAVKATHVLDALPADSVVNDVSASAAGSWVAGRSKTAGAWFAHLASGSPCSALLGGAANAGAVVAMKDSALIVIEVAGKLRLARLNAGGCGAPSFTSPDLALPAADSASARDLLVIDSTAYLVGHARTGAAEPFGFVAQLDAANGALGAFVRWDPGPGAESLNGAVAVGSRLFAGGVRGASQPDDDTSGAAGVAAWALPLQSDAAPVWTEQPKGRRVQALAENGSAVFALVASGIGTSTLVSFPSED